MAQGIDTTAFTNGFDAVLKDFFEGTVRKHLNENTTILKHIERSKRQWSGRQVRFPVNLRRTSGVGARSEAGTLPEADRQRYADSTIGAKFLYGRIELTGPVIEASRNDRGAFAAAMRQEVDGMRRDLRDDVNRQLYGVDDGAGNSGVLCLTTGAGVHGGGTTTWTVDTPGSRYIKPGMKVVTGTGADMIHVDYPGSGGTQVHPVTVATVPTRSTFTATGDFSANGANNDLVVRGDASDHSLNKELTGLSQAIAAQTSGTFQGINTATFPEWAAQSLDGPGGGATRPLSLELMQLAIDACDEVGGEEPNLIIGHHSARREYIDLLTSDVRYSPEQLKGGFQTLTYAGGTRPIAIEFDKHATYNQFMFLNTSDIKWYVQKDWSWANRDGSIMNRKPNQDAWEAFMSFYGDLGIERRNSHCILKDLEVSNLIF